MPSGSRFPLSKKNISLINKAFALISNFIFPKAYADICKPAEYMAKLGGIILAAGIIVAIVGFVTTGAGFLVGMGIAAIGTIVAFLSWVISLFSKKKCDLSEFFRAFPNLLSLPQSLEY